MRRPTNCSLGAYVDTRANGFALILWSKAGLESPAGPQRGAALVGPVREDVCPGTWRNTDQARRGPTTRSRWKPGTTSAQLVLPTGMSRPPARGRVHPPHPSLPPDPRAGNPFIGRTHRSCADRRTRGGERPMPRGLFVCLTTGTVCHQSRRLAHHAGRPSRRDLRPGVPPC